MIRLTVVSLLALVCVQAASPQPDEPGVIPVAAPSAEPLAPVPGPVLPAAEPATPPFPTTGEKFNDYVHRTIGPARLFGSAFTAAFSQWGNQPEEWGQGWDAYGQRYGSRLAYNGIRQTISLGASFAFGEDNRYFRSRDKRLRARVWHALSAPFIARHRDGTSGISASNLAGVAGATAIASAWGPPGWKGAKNITADAGISIAGSAAFNLIREFLPERRR